MKTRLMDIAKIIRSKNAGPYELTFDILFKKRKDFELFREKKLLNVDTIAALYNVPVSKVLGIIYFDPANAIKITMKRRLPSGAPGETDVYGAQQHAPLLYLTFNTDTDTLEVSATG